MSEKDTKKENPAKREPRKYKKREYLNDFKLQDNGEYAYEGIVYVYQGDWKEDRKQLRILAAVLCALVLAAGVIPSAGMMNTAYVILPYVGEVFTTALFTYEVIRLTSRDGNIRAYIYEKTFDRFRGHFLVIFVCAVMILTGEIIHMIVTRFSERILYTLLNLAVQFFVFGIAAALNRQVQAMKFLKRQEK